MQCMNALSTLIVDAQTENLIFASQQSEQIARNGTSVIKLNVEMLKKKI